MAAEQQNDYDAMSKISVIRLLTNNTPIQRELKDVTYEYLYDIFTPLTIIDLEGKLPSIFSISLKDALWWFSGIKGQSARHNKSMVFDVMRGTKGIFQITAEDQEKGYAPTLTKDIDYVEVQFKEANYIQNDIYLSIHGFFKFCVAYAGFSSRPLRRYFLNIETDIITLENITPEERRARYDKSANKVKQMCEVIQKFEKDDLTARYSIQYLRENIQDIEVTKNELIDDNTAQKELIKELSETYAKKVYEEDEKQDDRRDDDEFDDRVYKSTELHSNLIGNAAFELLKSKSEKHIIRIYVVDITKIKELCSSDTNCTACASSYGAPHQGGASSDRRSRGAEGPGSIEDGTFRTAAATSGCAGPKAPLRAGGYGGTASPLSGTSSTHVEYADMVEQRQIELENKYNVVLNIHYGNMVDNIRVKPSRFESAWYWIASSSTLSGKSKNNNATKCETRRIPSGASEFLFPNDDMMFYDMPCLQNPDSYKYLISELEQQCLTCQAQNALSDDVQPTDCEFAYLDIKNGIKIYKATRNAIYRILCNEYEEKRTRRLEQEQEQERKQVNLSITY